MRYVEARLDESERDEAYRIFVTKSLQLAPQQKYLDVQYHDLFKPQKIETRTSDEIAVDIISRAGLKFEE